MAYSVSVVNKYSEGPLRCNVLSITADAATQNVATGLNVIDHFVVGVQSLSTAAIKIYPNKGAEATSIVGTLGISGCANGDVFFVKVYGR